MSKENSILRSKKKWSLMQMRFPTTFCYHKKELTWVNNYLCKVFTSCLPLSVEMLNIGLNKRLCKALNVFSFKCVGRPVVWGKRERTNSINMDHLRKDRGVCQQMSSMLTFCFDWTREYMVVTCVYIYIFILRINFTLAVCIPTARRV